MSNEIHTGSCLCGAVSFEVRGRLRDVIACHCVQCRKQTGSFYMASAAEDDDLTVRGEANITWYSASQEARRGFCSKCGSALFWKRDGASYTSILAGAIDAPTGIKVTKHIFVGSKGDYYDITDDLPKSE